MRLPKTGTRRSVSITWRSCASSAATRRSSSAFYKPWKHRGTLMRSKDGMGRWIELGGTPDHHRALGVGDVPPPGPRHARLVPASRPRCGGSDPECCASSRLACAAGADSRGSRAGHCSRDPRVRSTSASPVEGMGVSGVRGGGLDRPMSPLTQSRWDPLGIGLWPPCAAGSHPWAGPRALESSTR
jgi:hypothetical protein